MPFTATILCVDDDEDDLSFIREAIDSQGHQFTIVEAMNGQEAMDFLQDALQKSQLPCLIIMDLNMPKMNGRETIDRIRADAALAAIPLAVFTTSSNTADKKYFEGSGIHFFTKPSDYRIFNQHIVDLLALCASLKG